MYQREAMWIKFKSSRAFAIKIFVGGINAVSGELQYEDEACQRRLLEKYESGQCVQDYVVSPQQPWLDGIADRNGTVRQFVAMPLGSGYSVEAQITGEEMKGGIQIQVTPQHRPSILSGMREADLPEVFVKTLASGMCTIRTPLDTTTIQDLKSLIEDKTAIPPDQQRLIYSGRQLGGCRTMSENGIIKGSSLHLVLRLRGGGGGELTLREQEKMGLAAGGRIKQSIVRDTTVPTFWDGARTTTANIHIVNSTVFKQITGIDPPETPITAKTYEEAGHPYFDIWNEKPSGIKGGFEGVRSVNQIDKESEQNGATRAAIQEVENSTSHPIVKLDRCGKRQRFRHVKDLEEELEELLNISDT
ncbi:Ubiquitin-60S ribosomal protein L40 [Lasiodiplodia theobromae]|uniref:Ubiquitin-60S ribosomal protein L40 n=1 Tax=Lasiodiplodia theobromae TaxID=45133 RepID=A0A5N5DL94_9PEZI|nr:Ubiquitin-60S ribosomal protein L40 [Lasiodiplodia theobromae]